MQETEYRGVKEPSMLKTSMNYGLITGIGLILVSVIFYLMGELGNQWVNFVSFLVLIIAIILAIKNFRDQELGGYIAYSKALGLGTLTGLFAAVLSSIFGILLFHVIDPGAMQQVLLEAELNIIERMPEISDAQLEQTMRVTRGMMRPAIMFLFGVFTFTFMAFIFSLVISAFMKRNPPVE